MQRLIDIDTDILLWINHHHAAWADQFMWVVSSRWTWLPLYAMLIGLLFWRFGWRRALVFLVAIAAAVGLSDWVSSGIIKHLVCRLRPTHEPLLTGQLHIVRDYVGGLYGFVSSHAANTMSVALLYTLIWTRQVVSPHRPTVTHYPNVIVPVVLFLWVVLNCYSRMYLGVHYPGDILGGLFVGVVMALLIYTLVSFILHKKNTIRPN